MTVLMALSSIAMEQTKVTERTLARRTQLLDYLAGHTDAKVQYQASDMIMNIHSNLSYLFKEKARSRTCGHFFLGRVPKDGKPTWLNGVFHMITTILRFVVASAAEAELGALYHNCQTGIIFRLTLTDMGHPQSNTPVHCGNATAVGIANNTIKGQCSGSMEMRFVWVRDKIAQEMYNLKWHPQENLANYQRKHRIGSHHAAVCPWYLHMKNCPRVLPRAVTPSNLKGCVGTLKNGYVCNVPLPRAPRIQSASHVTNQSQVDAYKYASDRHVTNQPHMNICYSQEAHVLMWCYLIRSLVGLGSNILPFSPVCLMQ